jgi:hypothetical protein
MDGTDLLLGQGMMMTLVSPAQRRGKNARQKNARQEQAR